MTREDWVFLEKCFTDINNSLISLNERLGESTIASAKRDFENLDLLLNYLKEHVEYNSKEFIDIYKRKYENELQILKLMKNITFITKNAIIDSNKRLTKEIENTKQQVIFWVVVAALFSGIGTEIIKYLF